MTGLWCRLLGHRWEQFACWWNDDEWRAGLPSHVERICTRCLVVDDGLNEMASRLTEEEAS